MSANGIFITGTGTDVGKTFAARMLVEAFADSEPVAYMKPVQTGCIPNEHGTLRAPDYDAVLSDGKAGNTSDYETHVPYRFEQACSPHLAARLNESVISLEYIQECFNKISRQAFTIVEGAGGILVPLTDTLCMVDLIRHLSIPVVLVTTCGLGTLNHTFLTMEVLKQHKCPVAGVIFNNPDAYPENYIYHDNLRMIRARIRPIPTLEVHNTGELIQDGLSEFTKRIRFI